MLLRLCLLLCVFFPVNLLAAECLQSSRLKALDAQYEEALRVGDVKFLHALLADDFVWVHNLEADIESKSGLLKRLKADHEIAKARTSHDITLHALADTVVLSGLSSVDKYNPDGKTFRTSRYRFMRTYVAVKDQCKLLSVQTMKVWSSENASEVE
ncbi:MAG TPA: nuclear transport factor 2 family protein [Cellvibrio sp.]|nr:nuclear transport factor 2 family protein [Cellvibrio sp.]